jgi:predicted NBD/HSP70 family sugar kinase
VPLHIAVDIGGTTCRVAGYANPNTTEWVDCQAFEVEKVDKNADARRLNRAFENDLSNLFAHIHHIEREPASISVAVAGKVSRDRSLIVGAGNLIHWVGRSFVADLHGGFYDCPVVLGNDAEAAALADALYGNGQDKNFLTMIWGSGVGGCGLYWRGGLAFAHKMEPGHIQIRSAKYVLPATPCGCGRWRCLEAYCGGDNIEKRHGSAENVTDEEWERYGRAMALGIMDVLMLHPDLECVIFSGGVVCKQSWLLPLIEHELAQQTMFEPPEVILSKFGESAGTHGALALGNRLLNGDAVAS